MFYNLPQQTVLDLAHRIMTTYLNYIWDLDTPLEVSTDGQMLYARAVLLCVAPRPLSCLGREVRQFPNKLI